MQDVLWQEGPCSVQYCSQQLRQASAGRLSWPVVMVLYRKQLQMPRNQQNHTPQHCWPLLCFCCCCRCWKGQLLALSAAGMCHVQLEQLRCQLRW